MNYLKSSTLIGEVRVVSVSACLCVQSVLFLPHRILRLCKSVLPISGISAGNVNFEQTPPENKYINK